MTRDAQARWIPSPNFCTGRDGCQPAWLILHGTAGGSNAVALAQNWFALESSQVSSHYVIGQDGTIVQTVDEDDWAWANGSLSAGHDGWWDTGINPNKVTISIEHMKPDTTNAAGLTTSQKDVSFALIKRICERWGIPKRYADGNGGITGHYSIDPINRQDCPGTFPWDELWAYLAGTHQPEEPNVIINLNNVSQWFADAGNGNWHCQQTNHRIGGAILTFYRAFGNAGLCGLTYLGLPLSDEVGVSKDHPEVKIQRFERGILVYDPHKVVDRVPAAGDVYMLHIDGGIGQQAIAQPLVQSIQTKLTAIQNAYNAVAAEKNGFVAEINQLKSDIDKLKSQPVQPDTAAITQLTQQIQAMTTKLQQISTLAKV